jgi:hypothetical protein
MDAAVLVRDARADSPVTQRRSASAVEWVEEETLSHLAAAQDVARAGAGGLLLAISVTELLLGVWAAGLWQRSVAVLVAAVGVAALALAVLALARRPASSDRLQPADAAVPRSIDGHGPAGARDFSRVYHARHSLRGA